MTTMRSFGGSMAWAAVATLLLLATFEPVRTEAPALSPNGTFAVLA